MGKALELRSQFVAVVAQLCPTLCNPMDYSPPGSSVHGMDSPGKNTGEGSHSLLQRIFLTQGSNPGLLHPEQILYHLSYREEISVRRRKWNQPKGKGQETKSSQIHCLI